MKLIEQKIYLLGNQSGTKLNETDNLLICINGKSTGVNISEFFISLKQYESELKAHSLVGEYSIENYRVKINEHISLSLWNRNSEEEVFITKWKYPVIQAGDLELDDVNFINKLEALHLKLFPTVQEIVKEVMDEQVKEVEPQIIKEEEVVNKTEQQIPIIEDIAIEVKDPISEAPLNEEQETEEEIKSESAASNGEELVCEPYEEMIKEGKLIGWEEYKDGNYRLLINEANDETEKNLVTLLLITSNKAYQKIPFKAENKDINNLILNDGTNTYTFKDGIFKANVNELSN